MKPHVHCLSLHHTPNQHHQHQQQSTSTTHPINITNNQHQQHTQSTLSLGKAAVALVMNTNCILVASQSMGTALVAPQKSSFTTAT